VEVRNPPQRALDNVGARGFSPDDDRDVAIATQKSSARRHPEAERLTYTGDPTRPRFKLDKDGRCHQPNARLGGSISHTDCINDSGIDRESGGPSSAGRRFLIGPVKSKHGDLEHQVELSIALREHLARDYSVLAVRRRPAGAHQ
jgi:hypothetical protein